jgi:hypothetical protein
LLRKLPASLFTDANEVGRELCRLAVSNYGKALEFVPWERLNLPVAATKELIFTAVKQDGKALRYVDMNTLTAEEYTELCRIAMEREYAEF